MCCSSITTRAKPENCTPPLHDRLRADDYVDLAGAMRASVSLPLLAFNPPIKSSRAHLALRQERPSVDVLPREHLGRRHDRCLMAVSTATKIA